jgi:beta-lactamase regulating signal transducer with metallopeptidase domain
MMQPDYFSTIVQALGLAVVHSLWQIALIWLIFKALTWRLQRLNNAVYLLALAAMFTSAIWSAATFKGEYRRLSAEAEVVFFEKSLLPETALETNEAEFPLTKPTEQSLFSIAQNWLEQNAALVGWAWLLCASMLWLRLLGGWWVAQRLRRQGVLQPGEAFQNLCGDWAKKLKIKQKVALLESSRIGEPLTLGFWKPVILFPVGMLAQLSPDQSEALFLHELAHIRRHDYLVNLLQLALEVCFFYHPLFWLLSQEARDRREFCCDDIVLRRTSNPILYAKTLTDLQLSFVHTQNHFAMNATGKRHFTERILRIAGITPKRSLRSNWLILLLLPLFVALSSWWPAAQTPLEMPVAVSVNLVEPSKFFQKTNSPIRLGAKNPDSKPTLPLAGDTVAPGYVVAAAPLKMNVFYIGVDNPLRVAASGIPAGELSLRLIGAGTLTGSGGDYVVQVTQPGEVIVQVYRKQGAKETLLSELKYRAKRIPDPTPKLGGKYLSQTISLKTLKEMRGIEAVLDNFLLDATCEVMWYEMTVLPKNADPVSFNVTGGAFPPRAGELFNSLDSLGGSVFMDDIRVKCPGDATPRNVGGLAFKVKAVE